MTQVRQWRVRVDRGVWLAGDERGHPDAPTIVLVHGAASNRRWWDPVAALLATDHRVVRYDHRGHGGSTSPTDGYTVRQLAADAVAVLERRGLGPVVLAGHSAGADVALTVAATRADLVCALAGVEGGMYDPQLLHGPVWSQARERMLTNRRGRTTTAVLRAWLHAQALPDQALPSLVANYVHGGDGRLHLRLAAAHEEQLAASLWAHAPTRLLAAVPAPVLAVAAVIGSEREDQPRRESLRRARQVLPDRLDVRWVPGGHHLPLQQPAAVADALADLAASTAPARSLA